MNSRTRHSEKSPIPQNGTLSLESENTVKVNGLEQVIDLLRHADPSFRNSLLKRLQARDPALARKLLQIIR